MSVRLPASRSPLTAVSCSMCQLSATFQHDSRMVFRFSSPVDMLLSCNETTVRLMLGEQSKKTMKAQTKKSEGGCRGNGVQLGGYGGQGDIYCLPGYWRSGEGVLRTRDWVRSDCAVGLSRSCCTFNIPIMCKMYPSPCARCDWLRRWLHK